VATSDPESLGASSKRLAYIPEPEGLHKPIEALPASGGRELRKRKDALL
jgi:hypothetical protein